MPIKVSTLVVICPIKGSVNSRVGGANMASAIAELTNNVIATVAKTFANKETF